MSAEFGQLQRESAAGNLEAVRSLLDGGVDLNTYYGAPHGWSPLMAAAYHGHLAVVRLLVERGARLDAIQVDRWGTALDIAREAGRDEIAAYLAAAGCPTGDSIPNPHRGGRLGGWGSGAEPPSGPNR
jgi:ankyrin repeat protein